MATASSTVPVRGDNLALIFQEIITVTERLRAGRLRFDSVQVFRNNIRRSIDSAQKEALRRGYAQSDVNVATFAVVVFLDESILNSRNPSFADWQSKPLQFEMFHTDEGGEIIFHNIDRFLGQRDSESVADLLEVHQLVLALGLRGRYSASGTTAEITTILQKIDEKIRRIRGIPLGIAWQPPAQTVIQAGDPWIPILKWVAIGCTVLALVAFAIFKFSLLSAITELGTLASQIFS